MIKKGLTRFSGPHEAFFPVATPYTFLSRPIGDATLDKLHMAQMDNCRAVTPSLQMLAIKAAIYSNTVGYSGSAH